MENPLKLVEVKKRTLLAYIAEGPVGSRSGKQCHEDSSSLYLLAPSSSVLAVPTGRLSLVVISLQLPSGDKMAACSSGLIITAPSLGVKGMLLSQQVSHPIGLDWVLQITVPTDNVESRYLDLMQRG